MFPVTKETDVPQTWVMTNQVNPVNLETVPSKMAFKERPPDLEFEAGSGGLWSTIGDYLKFAILFVENGSSDGVQILKPETIHFMCSNQLTDYQREHSRLMDSPMFREHYGFGLGLAVVLKESNVWINAMCGFSWLCWLARVHMVAGGQQTR